MENGKKLKQLNAMLSELDNVYQSLLKANNVSESEYIVMFSIADSGEGASQKEISENTNISRKTINAAVKKLQKDGILELKAAKYPNMQIFLTEKGRKFLKENIMPVIEVEKEVLSGMSDNEFEFLSAFYKIYIKDFKAKTASYIKNKTAKQKPSGADN